jgi:hypothetical protein
LYHPDDSCKDLKLSEVAFYFDLYLI